MLKLICHFSLLSGQKVGNKYLPLGIMLRLVCHFLLLLGQEVGNKCPPLWIMLKLVCHFSLLSGQKVGNIYHPPRYGTLGLGRPLGCQELVLSGQEKNCIKLPYVKPKTVNDKAWYIHTYISIMESESQFWHKRLVVNKIRKREIWLQSSIHTYDSTSWSVKSNLT